MILRGDIEFRLGEIGNDRPGAATGKRCNRNHDADRAGTKHDSGVTGRDACLGRRLHTDGERLDHRPFRKADIIRQLEGVVGRMHDEWRQHAMNRWRRPEDDRRIDIVHAETARFGIGIRNAGLHADAVTDLQMRHTCADFHYRSCRFVPEHHRFVDDEGADLAVRVIVHIRPADTDRMDLDLHLARPDLLRQIDIADRQFMLTLQNQGTHLAHCLFLFSRQPASR